MWGSLATAALLVFVDVMKELPATFAMRPFNFDTLGGRSLQLRQGRTDRRGRGAFAGHGGIALLPLILLSRQIARSSLNKSS